MAMVHLTIDGVPVSVEEGTTVLKAAHAAGIKIPTLCWLKDINEIGACRMCVVDVGARSLAAACVMPVSEGMVVKTNPAGAPSAQSRAGADPLQPRAQVPLLRAQPELRASGSGEGAGRG